MTKGRLEAFSDGVLAVIITIMVLEIKVPHGAGVDELMELVPRFLGYVLSFVYIAIYWNNHHHMLHATARIDGRVMWANMHLLFWLSLIPMVTGWVAEHPNASIPAAVYGVLLLFSGIAWLILQHSLIRVNGKDSALATAVGDDRKGNLSAILYAFAIGLAFVRPWIAELIYALVAMIWFIPDRRIEAKVIAKE